MAAARPQHQNDSEKLVLAYRLVGDWVTSNELIEIEAARLPAESYAAILLDDLLNKLELSDNFQSEVVSCLIHNRFDHYWVRVTVNDGAVQNFQFDLDPGEHSNQVSILAPRGY